MGSGAAGLGLRYRPVLPRRPVFRAHNSSAATGLPGRGPDRAGLGYYCKSHLADGTAEAVGATSSRLVSYQTLVANQNHGPPRPQASKGVPHAGLVS